MKYFFLFVVVCAYAVIPEKVILCGVCKDVEPQLPFTIQIMERIGALFEDYQIIVYENNSADLTKKYLTAWAQNNLKVFVKMEKIPPKDLREMAVNCQKMSEEELKEIAFPIISAEDDSEWDDVFHSEQQLVRKILRQYPNCANYCGMTRVEAIARARNIVLEYALSDAYEEYPYIIWIDMDFKEVFVEEAFQEIFANKENWDAVFANGITHSGKYFDWFAFRDLKILPLGPEVIPQVDWKNRSSLEFLEGQWYPVISAFGGLGVYKKAAVRECRYSSFVTPEWEEITKEWMQAFPEHPMVLEYQKQLQNDHRIVKIDAPLPGLLEIYDPQVGIILSNDPDPIVWRMVHRVFSYQYPCICEHVALHASMIARGYNRFFIHPKMVCLYEIQK